MAVENDAPADVPKEEVLSNCLKLFSQQDFIMEPDIINQLKR